jgi:3-phosphoshikimate 1-carboxyvinyltransferase
VTPAPAPLVGTARVPGDKSISHRALLLAAVARGASVVRGINRGRDVLATARAIGRLGARATMDPDAATAVVESPGWDELVEPPTVIDAGNSGTTLRTVLGLCATIDGGAALTGDATLRRRPMGRVVEPLRAMGATVDGRRGGHRAPLWVRGGPLRAIEWRSPVASAQVKTALLLAGLRAEGRTRVVEPRPSRDHTERMLAAAGVVVDRDGSSVAVAGGQEPSACDRAVPGDPSSAAFLLAAASLVPGSDVAIEAVGVNPTRTGAIEVLREMGADIALEDEDEAGGEPVATLRARASRLVGVEVGAEVVPRLIDEIPVLAVVATQAHGRTRFTGASELRVKESDRIDTVVTGLRRLGARAEARADGLEVSGPTRLHGGVVDARGDHRIALAFAVAALAAGVEVRIRGWGSVGTSFPGWDEVVAALRARS